jgi:ADP-L-glycero-D-manno-heptose 6-epimerase
LENDGRKLMVKNYQYSVSLFETALAYDVPVKYCSSASIYGKTVDPSKETDPLTALNPYAFSKLMVERWLEQNENTVTAFRLFNVYGDHEDHKIYRKQASPISKFIHEVQHTGSVTLFNGSKGIFRDFICVDDVATVMINFPSKKFGSYNLGTGQTWLLRNMVELLIGLHFQPIFLGDIRRILVLI